MVMFFKLWNVGEDLAPLWIRIRVRDCLLPGIKPHLVLVHPS